MQRYAYSEKERTKRFVRSILIKVLALSLLTATVSQGTVFIERTYGYTAVLGTVSAKSARVRSDAGTASPVAFCVSKGQQVTVLDEKKDSSGTLWYKIQQCNSVGYIRSDLITKTNITVNVTDTSAADTGQQAALASSDASVQTADASEAVPQTSKIAVIKGNYVRVRKESSTKSPICCSLNNGHALTILGEGENEGRNWYNVETDYNGTKITGYVAADYVTVTEQVNETAAQPEPTADTTAADGRQAVQDAAGATLQTPAQTYAGIKGTGVRIRQNPVNGQLVVQLSNGHPLVIQSEENASDGYKWYKVSFSYMGSAKEGYVRSDLVNVVVLDSTPVAAADGDFENSIAAFPESYKDSLRRLHANHPQWTFEPVNTGLEWNAALTAQSTVGKNLVSKYSIASWKSTVSQAYNWAENYWYTFDGGSWVSASPELIAYYMDPRNFLTESGIYQFESLNYEDYQNRDGVNNILAGTFMSGEYTDTDGTVRNYPDTFVQIGAELGVNPYLLASRCVQEQGTAGSSISVSGTASGYEGYFNYYNIGAYAYGGREAPLNGLIYAAGSDEAYARPWNSRYKALYGGAKYIRDKYVAVGQDTLYFQKFNVVNSANGIYSHQYMNSLLAASSESTRMAKAYTNNNEKLRFKIPFYSGMPDSPCVKPTSDSSPNTYLSNLWVDGYEVSPKFSGVVDKYTITVPGETASINIGATAVDTSASIGGTGQITLAPGTNVLNIVCKSQNGNTKTYVLTVNR